MNELYHLCPVWCYKFTIPAHVKGSSQEIGRTTLLIESVKDRDKTLYYEYDQSGIRIKKTVGSNVTKFHTDGGKILVMEKDGKQVHFVYEQDGSLFAMKVVNGTTVTNYYYEKNLQGDIVGIIDSSGNRIVSYKYDSWGRMLATEGSMATTIGSLNPFRYRGYFYDDETGWYYLKSRYLWWSGI